MAERIQVELVDDIDGSQAKHTVTFALDGVTYEIDLNDRHAQHLRSIFASYIERARKPAATTSHSSRQQEREERQNRQANRRLTEQIRGAAQRTRDRFKEQEEASQKADLASDPDSGKLDSVVSQEAPSEDSIPDSSMEEPAQAEEELKQSEVRVPAVSLPQFSSAVD